MRMFVFILLVVAVSAAGFHFNEDHTKKLRDWETEMAKCKAQGLIPMAEFLKTGESLAAKKQKTGISAGERDMLAQKTGAFLGSVAELLKKSVVLLEHKPGWFGYEGASLTEDEEKQLKTARDLLAQAEVVRSVMPLPAEVTITQPVQIRVSGGTVTLPVGTKVRTLSRDDAGLHIQYIGNTATVPGKSTNLAR